jgi:hypothetical protein
MLGFSLDLGFGIRRRILDFRLFLLFCFTSSGKPWAKGGVLTKDLARQLTAPIGPSCPHQPRLPPPVLPAPTCLSCPHRPRLPLLASPGPVGLVCPHGEEDGSALVLGIGLRLWQSALGFPSLSFLYKVHSFPSFCIDRQFIFFSIFSCQYYHITDVSHRLCKGGWVGAHVTVLCK